GGAIPIALAEDRQPAQTGLGALQGQHLEEVAVVVDGDAPLLVVIRQVQRIVGGPAAADGHASPPARDRTGGLAHMFVTGSSQTAQAGARTGRSSVGGAPFRPASQRVTGLPASWRRR